jgi:hypothetical protein
MMSLTRFSRFLFVASVAVGASLGIANCGPDYAIYSIHINAATPTNNLAKCQITITDEGGLPVLDHYPLGQQYGTADSLAQGCGGALTPANGNIGTFSFSTSRSGGKLTFLVEGLNDSNEVVQSGSDGPRDVTPYPPEIKVQVSMTVR